MKTNHNPLRHLYPQLACEPELAWKLCTIHIGDCPMPSFRRPAAWTDGSGRGSRWATSRLIYCADCGTTIGRIHITDQPYSAASGICQTCAGKPSPSFACAQYTRVPGSLLGGYVCNLDDPFLLLAPQLYLDYELSLTDDWSAVTWLPGSLGNPISDSKYLDTHFAIG